MMFANIENELYLIFFAAIAILAVLNPLGNLTWFLTTSEGLPLRPRKKLFATILYTAFIIVLIFLFSGFFFMSYAFRVDLNDLRVTGGLILIIMAVKNLLFPTKLVTQDFSHYQEFDEKELLRRSPISMAFPMLVGPGISANVVVIAEDGGVKVALGVVLMVFLFMAILFYYAMTIKKIVGKLTLHVSSRIAQVFIVAMGVKMMIVGIKRISGLN